MPFIIESLKELRKRENLSLFSFCIELEKCGKDQGLEGNFSFTPQTIMNYEKSRTSPRVNILDVLYLYAWLKGYSDLEFYKPPQ